MIPKKITETCDHIKDLLLKKNKAYGNSALDPVRIFSKSTVVEQLYVRIDDKLSRIARGSNLLESDKDVIVDLIGYLVLLKIAIEQNSQDQWNGHDIIDPGFTDIDAWIESQKNGMKYSD